MCVLGDGGGGGGGSQFGLTCRGGSAIPGLFCSVCRRL